MRQTYDVIVLGLGGMGSAAAYQLAARGQRVLGLERHTPAHALGSSHGQTRITRQAYFEDPAYVPLLLRAYELWDQIEAETGRDLLTMTGGLMIGPPDSHIVLGSQRSALQYGLRHEMLDAQELQRRYPAMRPPPDTIALFEYKAGFLRPEACVQTHLDRAAQLGATLHFEEPALAWEATPSGDGARVTTAKGSYEAGRLVISPGPWAPQTLADLGIPLRVERQVMYWFDPVGGVEPFAPDRFPIYIWQIGDMDFYGFPACDGPGGGVKFAFGRIAVPGVQYLCTPETIDREVYPVEIDLIRQTAATYIPDLAGRFLYAKTCMYTTTPDNHFIITTHPAYPQVALAAGFSGHGFKFTSVVGEILADLTTQGTTRHPIGLFNLERFTTA